MKQIKSKVGLRLLAGGLLWLLALGALAAQTKIGNLYYYLDERSKEAGVDRKMDDGGNQILYSGDIVIPESVTYNGTTYAVTSIYDAFEGCIGLTSVTIPNSVTYIGPSAFRDCTGLTSIEIPSSVTTIGNGTFSGCTGLTSVSIPNAVTSIGSSAFGGCTGLTAINVDELNEAYCSVDGVLYNKDKTSLLQCPGGKTGVVNIPNSVTFIDYSAFYGCTGLTSIEIPNSVTKIGWCAFDGCTGLTQVTIADRETVLGLYSDVFKNCPIQTLYLGGNMSYSGGSPFCGLTTLETVTIGNSVTFLSGFSGCTGLTSIEIPSSVTSIGSSAFDSCTGLTSVTIPNSVTSIGDWAFAYCTSLTSIEIPSSVTEIGIGVFSGCTGLTAIDVDESNGVICSVDGVLYDKDKIVLLQCPGGKTGVMNIPNSVMFIGHVAFFRCTGLTSVTIPNSVTKIGNEAFFRCTGLTSVTIADRETPLEFTWNVFEDCPIRTLYLGGDIGYYSDRGGNSPFRDLTTLETLTIGGSVTKIESLDFSGCTGLTSVTIADRETVLDLYSDVFVDCPIQTLYLGGDIDAKGNDYHPFRGMTTLETLTIGGSATEIDGSVFVGCTGLKFIYVDESNDAYCVVDDVLYNKDKTCLLISSRGKTEVNIPASVTAIGAYAFEGCTGLTSFETGDAVKEIGDYAFQQCGGLLTLTFGKSVSKIGEGIVDFCDKLRRLICTSEEPAACNTYAFADIHKIRCDLIVPETALEAYKNALVWGDFLRIAGGDGSDKVYVERLSLTSPVTPAELKVGEGMLLSAVITPANATNQTLTWSSSDKNVLRVDYDGYVIAVGVGEAVVTARTTDGSNLSATCTVTVTAAGSGGSGDDGGDDGPGSGDDGPGGGDDGDDDKILVETLEISTGGASTELQAGGTLQLSAVITPSNATNKAVTWSSSDKKVATVDNDGYVVALAAGTVVITARTTDGSDLSATCTLTVTAAGSGGDGPGGGNTAVEGLDALKAVRVYADGGRIEVRGLPLGTAVTLSGVDGRLWYRTEAVTGPELTLSAPRGHVYVLRLNHTHSLKVYLP